MPRPKTSPKSEETRERILATALELFRREGFEKTTMRGIASAAGVATGLAYYYFDSKEALVMRFYETAHVELQPMLEAAHAAHGKFEARLKALVQAKLDYFSPNRKFLGALMGTAADPKNALSPFSEATRAIRETDFGHYQRALDDTRTGVPADLAAHLPKLLWLYQMGIILFWLYDESEGQTRTERLLERSAGIVALLLKLAGLPLVKPARRMVIDLIEIVEG